MQPNTQFDLSPGIAADDLIAKNRRRALGIDKVQPNSMPLALAETPAPQFAIGLDLQPHSLVRRHVPTTGEALVQVLFVEVVCRCQLSAALGRDFGRHAAHHSDSLADVQAIRYSEPESGQSSEWLDNHGMETASERRKRKLQWVIANHGGLPAVAKAANLSQAALDQILKGTLLPPKADGTQSQKGLGSAAARALEQAFSLGKGWFDAPDAAPATSVTVGDLRHDEEDLILAYRKLPEDVQLELVRDFMALALRFDSSAHNELEKRQLAKTATADTVTRALAGANHKMNVAKQGNKKQGFAYKAQAKKTSTKKVV